MGDTPPRPVLIGFYSTVNNQYVPTIAGLQFIDTKALSVPTSSEGCVDKYHNYNDAFYDYLIDHIGLLDVSQSNKPLIIMRGNTAMSLLNNNYKSGEDQKFLCTMFGGVIYCQMISTRSYVKPENTQYGIAWQNSFRKSNGDHMNELKLNSKCDGFCNKFLFGVFRLQLLDIDIIYSQKIDGIELRNHDFFSDNVESMSEIAGVVGLNKSVILKLKTSRSEESSYSFHQYHTKQIWQQSYLSNSEKCLVAFWGVKCFRYCKIFDLDSITAMGKEFWNPLDCFVTLYTIMSSIKMKFQMLENRELIHNLIISVDKRNCCTVQTTEDAPDWAYLPKKIIHKVLNK